VFLQQAAVIILSIIDCMDRAPTIEEHIASNSGSLELAGILRDMAAAGKIIGRKVAHAMLTGDGGEEGSTNVHDERVTKLDAFADHIIYHLQANMGRLGAIGSEERADLVHIPGNGTHVLLYDPLDGSLNADYGISVGTIFGVWGAWPFNGMASGRGLVAAGYILYGPSTMMVYTTGGGSGAHGFTYNRVSEEFYLTHPSIRIPTTPKFYSANPTYEARWPQAVAGFYAHLRSSGPALRWVGTLVADFHRNLLGGGVFMYPAEAGKPEGKLRLMYEAAPLALIAAEAGGKASDGNRDILDLEPSGLHQRVPLFIGDKRLVELAESMVAAGSD
jgi:fructose-1,6-bisphosphatase I